MSFRGLRPKDPINPQLRFTCLRRVERPSAFLFQPLHFQIHCAGPSISFNFSTLRMKVLKVLWSFHFYVSMMCSILCGGRSYCNNQETAVIWMTKKSILSFHKLKVTDEIISASSSKVKHYFSDRRRDFN